MELAPEVASISKPVAGHGQTRGREVAPQRGVGDRGASEQTVGESYHRGIIRATAPARGCSLPCERLRWSAHPENRSADRDPITRHAVRGSAREPA